MHWFLADCNILVFFTAVGLQVIMELSEGRLTGYCISSYTTKGTFVVIYTR